MIALGAAIMGRSGVGARPGADVQRPLLQAVRAVDRLDAMAAELEGAPLTVRNAKGEEVAHPLLVESRQTSLMLARLLASLRLPSGLEGEGEPRLIRPQRRGAARGVYGIRGVG